MATARLRKRLSYAADADSEDDEPTAMDEEEQNSLIRRLQAQNTACNKQYTTLLLALALLSTLPYVLTLFTPSTTLVSLLSISSLLSTAYLLHTLPPTKTGIAFLDDLHAPSSKPWHVSSSIRARQSVLLGAGFGGGPVRLYLPYLNAALCGVLFGLGGVVKRRGGAVGRFWWGFEFLPGVIYGVTVAAKWIMGSVDPEEELGKLRYELKGA